MSMQMAFAAGAYRQAATTVGPLRAVVMVYDEIITSFARADRALDGNNPEEVYRQIERATTLLRGLRSALDYRTDEGFATQMEKVYTRLILAMHASFGKTDARERYGKLCLGIVELRNAWAEIGHLPPREETN
ncbi:MAG: flagellar protein FliS [Hyphomicrobiales bacterium]|nr:MAG: flagellar protein FliS [Hyphomicrobiales bacterium]